MRRKYLMDCGCGLTQKERVDTIFSRGGDWQSVFYSPSKKVKCRTCGRKYKHIF